MLALARLEGVYFGDLQDGHPAPLPPEIRSIVFSVIMLFGAMPGLTYLKKILGTGVSPQLDG